jgi:hypothetical protein
MHDPYNRARRPEVDLRTEDVRNLSRAQLETLAAGMPGYPPGRAGAAKEEILRRDGEQAERQERVRQRWTKIGAFAAIIGAIAAIAAAFEGWLSLPKK